jgi:hypothetical protein
MKTEVSVHCKNSPSKPEAMTSIKHVRRSSTWTAVWSSDVRLRLHVIQPTLQLRRVHPTTLQAGLAL